MRGRAEALVLRAAEYGEGHKIVTLLTREAGKIGLVARGAGKPRGRLTAACQPLVCGFYSFSRFGSSLGTLHSAEIERVFRRVREDLLLTAVAAYVMELTDRMLDDGEPQPEFYDQLKAGLAAMDEGKDPLVLMHALELKLLALGGYRPVLEGCVECGRQEGPFLFAPRLGGLFCSACADRQAGTPSAKSSGGFSAGAVRAAGGIVPLNASALRLLKLLGGVDLRRLGRVEVRPETERMLRETLRRYFEDQVDLKAKSWSLLENLLR